MIINQSKFHDLNIPSMRLYGLLSHFLLTTGLFWTKVDSIQVTITYGDNHKYQLYNSYYTVAISFGIILLVFRFLILMSNPYYLSIVSIINLTLDSIACLFISWIILDGNR